MIEVNATIFFLYSKMFLYGSIYDQSCETDIIMPTAGPRGAAPLLVRSGISGLQVTYVTDEKELFQELVTIMRRCVTWNQNSKRTPKTQT